MTDSAPLCNSSLRLFFLSFQAKQTSFYRRCHYVWCSSIKVFSTSLYRLGNSSSSFCGEVTLPVCVLEDHRLAFTTIRISFEEAILSKHIMWCMFCNLFVSHPLLILLTICMYFLWKQGFLALSRICGKFAQWSEIGKITHKM